MIIKTLNNLTEGVPKTHLTNLESAGTSVVRWKNFAGFQASWAVQIGETGEEQTETALLSSDVPSGTLGTLSGNTLYEHPTDTPLYAIKYDKIVFERSTSGTAGTATPMTDGTVSIQPDHKFTQFDDTSGSTSYAYKTYFRNSALAVNTTESGWLTSTGYTFYSLAKMRERIKNKLWNSVYVTDTEIDDWINEWKEKMRNTLVSVNEDYALGTVQVGFGTNGYGTITSTDFKDLRRLWVTYNGSDWYNARKMDSNDFLPNQIFNSTHPYFFMRGDSVFGVKPPESGGTVEAWYYSTENPMDDDTDEIPVPMRGYSKSFVDYGLAQALLKDGKIIESRSKEGDAVMELERFKKEVASRNKTGPTYISVVETVGGEDDLLF